MKHYDRVNLVYEKLLDVVIELQNKIANNTIIRFREDSEKVLMRNNSLEERLILDKLVLALALIEQARDIAGDIT